jgi:hypothetical protein
MTSQNHGDPVGVRAMPAPEDDLAALHRSLSSGVLAGQIRGALAGMSPALVTTVGQQIQVEAGRLLDLDPVTVFTSAWQTYDKLRAAAHRTVAEPDVPAYVEADRHTIAWESNPQIEVLVEDRVLATVTVGIRFDLEIDSLLVKVENGFLTAVLAGRCRGTFTLSANRARLAGRSITVDLFREVRLRRPVSLVSSRARASVPPRPVS